MKIVNKNNTRDNQNDLFIIFFKDVDYFKTARACWFESSGLTSQHLWKMEHSFLDFINAFDSKSIDEAIEANAKRTKIKRNRKEILIYYRTLEHLPISYADRQTLEVIPYDTKPDRFKDLDIDKKFQLIGTENIQDITSTRFRYLKEIVRIDSNMLWDDYNDAKKSI